MRLLLVGLGIFSELVYGSGEKHGEVKVVQKETELLFKVEPKTGFMLNPEGPWRLSVKGDIALQKSVFSKEDFDFSSAQFKVSGKNTGKLGYELTAFFCTQDHKVCFRDVFQAD